MAIKQIEPDDWGPYFDTFSQKMRRDRRTDYAEIRVFSTEDGAQKETAWLPLSGIVYDRKDNLLEVLVENMDHLVLNPSRIYVDETAKGMLTSMEVIRGDGTREVIEVR